jgi:4-amino-4-deoxy-L-arabinose transferase-like glycosyltransferase
MIQQIVAMALDSGAAELRRVRARLVAGAIALAAILIAFGFAVVGFFLWLTEHMASWQAALLAAVAALLVAGIAVLLGQSSGRRPPPRPELDLAAQVQSIMAQVTKDSEGKPMTAVTTALAAGIVLGRILSR